MPPLLVADCVAGGTPQNGCQPPAPGGAAAEGPSPAASPWRLPAGRAGGVRPGPKSAQARVRGAALAAYVEAAAAALAALAGEGKRGGAGGRFAACEGRARAPKSGAGGPSFQFEPRSER